LRRTAFHICRNGFLDLVNGQIFDARRDRPAMAKWVFEMAMTVAPKHVRDRDYCLRAGIDGVFRERIDILDVEVQRNRCARETI
jgi:hypothetical protein